MNIYWIFIVIFVGYFSTSTAGLYMSNDENLPRLKEEWNSLHDLFNNYIRENYDKLKAPGNKVTALDIVKKVLDTGDLGSLNPLPTSCPTYADSNDIYKIKIVGQPPFEVLCNSDIVGPGWTVIASRSNGDVNFFRGWEEYKNGFGDLKGEFFIGLEKLHAITVGQPQELYIYLEDFDGNHRYARYDEFLIGTENDKYPLAKLGAYVGDMGDSLKDHVGGEFRTYDSDYPVESHKKKTSWWNLNQNYRLPESNLFGLYIKGSNDYSRSDSKRMFWSSWIPDKSYKVMRMMVKPRCDCTKSTSISSNNLETLPANE